MWLQRAVGISHRANRWLALYISGIGILLAVVLTIVEASARSVFNQAFYGINDVLSIILAWTVGFALTYALIAELHVRITVLVRLLPSLAQFLFEIFADIVGAVCLTFLSIISWPYFWGAMLEKERALGPVAIPIWIAKLAIPVGSATMMIEFYLRMLQKLRHRKIPAEDK